MSELTKLEREVLLKLLDGNDESLSTLREQLNAASVREREMTGVGFYSTLAIPSNARRLSRTDAFKFGDVVAAISGLNHGAGFVLYVQNGALHMLEGYTYDEKWPSDATTFELSYISGDQRDSEALQQILYNDGE